MVSAFSVPKSKRQQKYNANPGPGNYNPETSPKVVKPNDPQYSFGKVERRQQGSFVPGPGSYEPKGQFTNEHAPKYTMQGKKDLIESKNAVGPGQYSPSTGYVKEKSASYSLGGRPKQNINDGKPGPGNYQVKGDLDLITKKHGWRFSKDGRDHLDKRNVPGPGSYQYENAVFKYGSRQDPAYGFGSKLQGPRQANNPGPGAYDEKHSIYSKIGGIISRDLRGSRDKSFTPGPGNYNNADIHGIAYKQPAWSMSKSSRDQLMKNSSLGPGQYEVDKHYKSVVTTNPGYHFGSEKRIKYDNARVPGPGQYQQQPIKSHRSIRIGEKTKDLSSSYVPGPGSYEYSKLDNDSWLKGSGRYSVGKSNRDANLNKYSPGPGAYESPVHDRKGKVTFGKDSRLKLEASKNPGPGQYDLKPYFADVPKYLLPGK